MHLGRDAHLLDQLNRRPDQFMRAAGMDDVFLIQKGYQFAMILPAAVASGAEKLSFRRWVLCLSRLWGG